MSRYSKMQAPPFWMWMFRIAGIACLVTLLTPTFYLIKYALVDHPVEEKVAESTSRIDSDLALSPFVDGTQLYIETAEGKGSSVQKISAVRDLGALAGSTSTQITHPVECLHAKLALEQVASRDPNADIRAIAQSTLMHVASNGAVIVR